MASTQRRDWFAVLFALGLPTLVTLAYFVWSEGFDADVQQAVYGVAKVIQFGFPIAWVWAVQRQRPRIWPLTTDGIGLGIAFGVCVMAAALGLYYGWLKSAEFFTAGIGPMQEKISEFGLRAPWKFAALGIFYSLCHSLLEEYYWRWFVFAQLKRLLPLWPAILISSLGFMAHHVLVVGEFFGFASPLTWLLSLAVATGGVCWAWLYHRSGSLLGPWVSHLLVDAAIFIIGYDIAKSLFGAV
jgi:membrane protease YdiL (CAAX protease family)